MENKHDHKTTKKLKVLLFAIVMLLPFIACLVECIYKINLRDSTTTQIFNTSLTNVFNTTPFNWTSTTEIYTTFNNVLTQLGIESTYFTSLLTYWFLIIVIYLIIDLIVEALTWLTHLLFERKQN